MSLEQAKEQLQAWLNASIAIANGGQSYKIGSRSLTRADAVEVRNMINHWQNEVNKLSGKSTMRIRRALVRDL